jgi:Flp pilus assembly protein TadB
MSADPDVPPPGEEIHLPGGTFLPLFLTVGITLVLVGLTTTWFLVIVGGIITLWVLIRWVLDARREFNELPLEHHH